MSREIKLKDAKLIELMKRRNEIVTQGRKDNKKIEQLQDRLNKSGLEVQKIDGQATEILKKKNIELTVDPENKIFEQIMGAHLEGGSIVVEIEDRVESFTKQLSEQVKQIEEKKDEVKEEPQEDK